jgi:hypothetical protein
MSAATDKVHLKRLRVCIQQLSVPLEVEVGLDIEECNRFLVGLMIQPGSDCWGRVKVSPYSPLHNDMSHDITVNANNIICDTISSS